MHHSSLGRFLRHAPTLPQGPCAVICCEDGVEVASTLAHHQNLGFAAMILLAAPDLTLDIPDTQSLHRVDYDTHAPDALPQAVTAMMRALSGRWVYAGYNAEYLFYPFCETRSVVELVDFHSAERRGAMACQVVDLYAIDLAAHPNGVARDACALDRIGYAARPREDAANNWLPKDRQFDLYGGLRWRFEEHVPYERRRIDRIALVQAHKTLTLKPDFTWSEEELNTIACPWHNSLTACVVSFRTAKALRSNPGASSAIDRFVWSGSERFGWTSRQLLDLGLMEPGQWF